MKAGALDSNELLYPGVDLGLKWDLDPSKLQSSVVPLQPMFHFSAYIPGGLLEKKEKERETEREGEREKEREIEK